MKPLFVRGAYLLVESFGVGILVFLAAHLAQFYLFFYRYESFVWFPGGVSLGLALRLGAKTLPGIFAGLAGYYSFEYGLPGWASLWTSASWVLCVAVFLYGMRRFGPDDVFKAPLRALVTFYALGVGLIPVLHTALDFPMMTMTGLIGADDDPRAYAFSYALGEAYSALLLAPGVFLLGRDFTPYYTGPLAAYPHFARGEKLVWSVAVAALVGATFEFGQTHFYAGIQDVELLLYPMLAWSALRLGVVFTCIAVSLVTMAVFSFSAFGLGGTPSPETHRTLIGLIVFVVTIAVMAQMLAVQDLERRLRAARLAHDANHDWLTGLDNIVRFRQVAALQIAKSRATGVSFALGYIITKEHQILEQGFGVEARNEFLRQLSALLRSSFPDDVSLARVTGGNFTALFTSDDPELAKSRLDEVRHRLASFRFNWGPKAYGVNPSFRLAAIDGSIENPDRLLEWLGAPLDEPEPFGSVHVLARASFRPMLDQRRERVQWLAEIQEALAGNRFELHAQRLQPIGPEAESRRRDGERLEILVRMRGADGTLQPPDNFLPHAERFLLLPKIDQWVFSNTVAWFAARPACLARTAKIAINLSGQSLSDRSFRESFQHAINRLPISPAKLCFEITESEAISNVEVAVSFFDQLRGLGCTVSLDDFGTGMSSFEYLKHFNCDFLKIDGIFIRQLTRQSTDYLIVKGIQTVAAEMGLETIAEYAESESVLECLTELGIDYAQGYAVGKPMPLAEFFELSVPERVPRYGEQ